MTTLTKDAARAAQIQEAEVARMRRVQEAVEGPGLKIAILGGGAKENDFTLYGNRWEIWGLNGNRPHWVPRFHRMFNLHRIPHLERDCPEYIEKDLQWCYTNSEVPFYAIGEEWAQAVPGYIEFPLDELRDLPRGGEYHASSFDMMVAFALRLGAVAIRIHGVSFKIMEAGEPISARACLEYWCGVAEGRGVPVLKAADCDALFYQFHYVRSRSIYGFDDVHMVEDRTK